MTRIGFAGLGHMGLPMAINLVKAGFTVTGFDLAPRARQALVSAGGIEAHSLVDVAHDQDVLITMLQTGEQVRQVCLGEAGLFAHARKGALYMDCSSIDVQTTRFVHEEALKAGIRAIDAPVSGGVNGATMGTLTFMAGGETDILNDLRPVLQALGKNVIHTGANGSGQAAKICNNLILGISMIAVSEAFLLGERLGLSHQKLFEVVNCSSGQCWSMSTYPPVGDVLPGVPATNDYKPGFTAAMMLKDLRLGQQSAEQTGLETPMAALAASLYSHMQDEGHGHLDFSAIIRELADEGNAYDHTND
ncbi:3-hydroxyisobutyrate dehydrogenase [Legionella geestiana]|uniref:3-hydroxyisobutyrate dehydrogenase n=1 Tax=Legionella geestiana TaxID=45065 RepID=A0A0W0TP04_9GAMM|nr:3-hydroxyisobutyrate dehydrogenase [Legionella geestiana]KTC97328.1 3-hydroxyisobutyrate dehydrogenase [Legionella geestiana]QBS12452.1 3-hydroxyisobutyrate dehydrogenase [Legionella geestiana]QDQ39832.1 3-hydroxyisobutyrate dehydrogenase [Legionella geestiana]STX55104.1 3-hydroxyisobutyrate dehydrogenase [Legionella geestiana]